MAHDESKEEKPAEGEAKPKPKRFPWLTKKLVITVIVIYAIIMVAAFLWTNYISGWNNNLWLLWLW